MASVVAKPIWFWAFKTSSWLVIFNHAVVNQNQPATGTGILSDHSFQHVTLTLPTGFCGAGCVQVCIAETVWPIC